MHGDENWPNPTFWFLSMNFKLLEIIKDSNAVHSTARSMIPDERFDVRVVTTAQEFQMANDDMAIVILPKQLNQEWQAVLNTWINNGRIGVLKEEELPEDFGQESSIDYISWLITRRMNDLPR